MFYRNNPHRFTLLALLLTLALFGNLSVASAQQATFTTGDVYSSTAPFSFGAVVGGIGVVPSAGGAVSNTFTVTAMTPQIAWSPDLTTAYASTNGGEGDQVLQLTPDGTVTTFATLPFSAFAVGTHPDGRVLVARLDGNEVYDISAGGAGPFPLYATLPFSGGNQKYAMLRTSAGRLLLSGSSPRIYDITDPANITVAADASGLPGSQGAFYDMAEGPGGEIYAWSADGKAVIKVTGGVSSIFATLPFLDSGDSVAYGYGKLLVGGTNFSGSRTRTIYDVSAGGDFPTAPAPFATHGDRALGSFLLDTVPALYPSSPQAQLAALIDQLQAMATAGVLTPNQGNALVNKLEHAIASLDKEKTTAACGQLGSFVNQVNAFINNGSLTQAQGQALINAATAVQTNLGC